MTVAGMMASVSLGQTIFSAAIKPTEQRVLLELGHLKGKVGELDAKLDAMDKKFDALVALLIQPSSSPAPARN